MIGRSLKSLFAGRDGTLALARRLLTEHALGHWRLYSLAFMLMAVTAGCTAASAYLLGNVMNQAYVDRNFVGVVTFARYADTRSPLTLDHASLEAVLKGE